jgi:hypothetical protein
MAAHPSGNQEQQAQAEEGGSSQLMVHCHQHYLLNLH